MTAAQICQSDAGALQFGLALQAVGRLLECQGWTPEQVTALITRARASRAEYAARYPVADQHLPLAERIRADERTLVRATQERAARQYVSSK